MLQSLKKQLNIYEEEKEKKRQNLSQFEQSIGQLQKQLKDKVSLFIFLDHIILVTIGE